jgi:ATP-dependent DNA helicase Rep
LLVLAGAGSGKTRVITFKITHLIRHGNIPARHIAAITFTNKAAREMLERVGKLLTAQEIRGITVSTFHSLGMQILRQEATHLGYKPQFSILDALMPARSSPTSSKARTRTKCARYKARFRCGKTT